MHQPSEQQVLNLVHTWETTQTQTKEQTQAQEKVKKKETQSPPLPPPLQFCFCSILAFFKSEVEESEGVPANYASSQYKESQSLP